MNIPETLDKVKPFYTLILTIFIAAIFFALGRLSAIEERKTPIRIESAEAAAVIGTAADNAGEKSTSSTPESLSVGGEVVGSKSGKKYYFPWCGTAKRIKPENQVHFGSIGEAKAAGFTAGGNCKGLQ